MEDEIEQIQKNDTWELMFASKDKKVIGIKWIYKLKHDPDGSIEKHKTYLVAKGYAQKEGIDYDETFSPIARLNTMRSLLALTSYFGLTVYHMDVKSTFLNGYLKEIIYVKQLEGFIVPNQEDKIYKLKKALYGLKQAPRAWYTHIDGYLQ